MAPQPRDSAVPAGSNRYRDTTDEYITAGSTSPEEGSSLLLGPRVCRLRTLVETITRGDLVVVGGRPAEEAGSAFRRLLLEEEEVVFLFLFLRFRD